MKNKETKSIVLKGKNYKIPPGGTLGLLALGNIGVRAWKESREKYIADNKQKEDEKK
jgi:hypothetical protein